MDLKELKESLFLPDVIRDATSSKIHLNIGYNTCPICGRSSKFRVKGTRWKCFHPDCRANKGGDLFDLLVLLDICTDLKSAFHYAYEVAGVNCRIRTKGSYTTRTKAMEAYVEYGKGAGRVVVNKWLHQRGLDGLDVEIGYAPSNTYLTETGLTTKQLEEVGLYNSRVGEVLTERVVFPIRDIYGNVVHFQGRSVREEEELRWYGSPSLNGDTLYNHAYGLNSLIGLEHITITEGVTDCLSLLSLGLPAAGTFGITPNLARMLWNLKSLKSVVFVYDNDEYALGTPKAGLPKSWSALAHSLVTLQDARPDLKLFCLTPPSKQGIKDINDWLLDGLTLEKFTAYGRKYTKPLGEWLVEKLYPWEEYHPLLWRVCESDTNARRILELKVNGQLQRDELSWGDYIVSLTGMV